MLKRILKNLFYYFSSIYIELKATLSTKYNKNKNEQYTLFDADVDPTSRNKVCIFSHFDLSYKIHDYVVLYIKELYELGFSIYFITTSPDIEQDEIKKVQPYISKFIIRSNNGRDFGSYRLGYKLAKEYSNYEMLLFANDSAYGPLCKLSNIFDVMNTEKCDVLGITDSWDFSYHLQSYFILMNQKAFLHKSVEDFFDNFKFSDNKNYIIQKYEIGLSKTMIRNGLTLSALCPYNTAAHIYYTEYQPTKYHRYNPTHQFWKILINNLKCPFIKRELLYLNPEKVYDVDNWVNVVEEKNYNHKLIVSHLKTWSAFSSN